MFVSKYALKKVFYMSSSMDMKQVQANWLSVKKIVLPLIDFRSHAFKMVDGCNDDREVQHNK